MNNMKLTPASEYEHNNVRVTVAPQQPINIWDLEGVGYSAWRFLGADSSYLSLSITNEDAFASEVYYPPMAMVRAQKGGARSCSTQMQTQCSCPP